MPNPEPAPLGRGRIVRQPNIPLGGAVPRFVAPTGPGERTLPEKDTGWSYHLADGFKMIDHPLGVDGRQKDLPTALAAMGYLAEPSLILGDPQSQVWVDVYDNLLHVQHIVIVHTRGVEQILLVKGFPSLLELLGKLHDVVADAGQAFMRSDALLADLNSRQMAAQPGEARPEEKGGQ